MVCIDTKLHSLGEEAPFRPALTCGSMSAKAGGICRAKEMQLDQE
jgi:hypothetical protein